MIGPLMDKRSLNMSAETDNAAKRRSTCLTTAWRVSVRATADPMIPSVVARASASVLQSLHPSTR
jgi:hypothetical protein